MKVLRIALHGFVLMIADLGGIAAGAVAAFQITGLPNQVGLQLPIAVLVSIALSIGWHFLLCILRLRQLQPAGTRELVGYLGLSLLWSPVVFVPLHYFREGYVTAWGNLVAFAVYQLPVNLLAVSLWAWRKSKCNCNQRWFGIDGR